MAKLKISKKLIIILFLIILLAAGFIFWQTRETSTPVPANFQVKTEFTMYYPKTLPDDFEYDEIAQDDETRVVTYSIASGDRKLYFSLQSKPDDFDLEAFNSEKITGGRTFETKIGPLTTGVFENQTVGSIIADSTWILITAGPGTSLDDIENVGKSMKQL